MRKTVILILLILLSGCLYQDDPDTEPSGERTIVTLDRCVDGDTAWFYSIGKARFLYIDTPEVYPEMQMFGQQAADHTCDALQNARVIEIEYDGQREDDYGRQLVWVWVDDVLLQEELARLGLVVKLYDYGNYRHKRRVDQAIIEAQKNKAGIYQ